MDLRSKAKAIIYPKRKFKRLIQMKKIALIATLIFSPILGREIGYSWLYGIKASRPQMAVISFTYISLERKPWIYKPFFQLEPGITGNKTSIGLGSAAGPTGFLSSRIKATYLNIWAIANSEWPSKYGYFGSEYEIMALFPSAHFGLYHPLDQNFGFSNLKASFGIGILF
jgi:hypothetical protein